MKRQLLVLTLLAGFIYLPGCSRKTTPAKTTETTTAGTTTAPGTSPTTTTTAPVPVKRPAPIKTAVPKSITVNDKAATKTVQGRYYYDLEGKRYWRNKKDGKYYLYYKGMFDKPEFQ